MVGDFALLCRIRKTVLVSGGGGGGGSYFPYILLNEIQTMFSQLAKRSARVLPADLCTDHAHYVKIHRSTVLRRNKNMAVEGGTVSHYYILVIRKFIDFMSLFRHSVWFSFSVKQVWNMQHIAPYSWSEPPKSWAIDQRFAANFNTAIIKLRKELYISQWFLHHVPNT